MNRMSDTVRELYEIFLKPNIWRRELWRVRRKGNTVTVVFWNDVDYTFEEYVLDPRRMK